MKKLLIPLLGILALAGTACEQHSAAELRRALGKHDEHAAAAPATPAPAVEAETAKPAGEPAADAPKFFQKK